MKRKYVVATKYREGDPRDHFCIGFTSVKLDDRYIIVDGDGNKFRKNGFRRIKEISPEVGDDLVRNIGLIEQGDKSIWWWVEQFELRHNV